MRIIAPLMILIMMTSTLAGCTGDDDPGPSKEELVQQIRNGEGGDLTGVDLSGSDLSGLQNMELFGTDFTGADLSLVDFTDSDLSYVDFTGATLSNAKFVNSNLEASTFSGNYSSLHIRDSNLKSASFSGKLEYFTFENVDLSWASFSRIYFGNSIRFMDSTLYATDFGCFKIEGDVRFFDNHMESLELNTYYITGYCPQGDPDWSNTVFRDNTFDGVNLEGWNGNEYDGATFLCNSFSEVDFSDTDFSNTHFQTVYSNYHPDGRYLGTEVCEQTFTDSWMEGSTFGGFGEGTSFAGSSLEYSSVSSVSEDVIWSDTICPDGTNSDDNENTCENNL